MLEKLENKGSRCYFVNNMYFIGAQAGIQAQHASTRLMRKYWNLEDIDSLEAQMVMSWAEYDETSIILNGGMHGDLVELHNFLCQNQNELSVPWASFEESEYAANSVMTSIAIVLPEWFWDATPIIHSETKELDKWQCGAGKRPEHVSSYLRGADKELKTKLSNMSLFRI